MLKVLFHGMLLLSEGIQELYVRESLELYIESLTGFEKDMSVRLMIAFCNTTSSIYENHYTPPLVYMLVQPVCK